MIKWFTDLPIQWNIMIVVSLLLDVHSLKQFSLMIGVLSGLAVERLEKLGMRKVRLPLGTGENEPHTVILVSNDFETNTEKLAVLVHSKLLLS
jgi:phosphatidylserine synthase